VKGSKGRSGKLERPFLFAEAEIPNREFGPGDGGT
jgi:hypothetical protein